MPHPTIQHPATLSRILLFAARTNLECWTLGGVTSTWKQTVEPGEYGGIGAKVWNNLLPKTQEEVAKRKYTSQTLIMHPDGIDSSLPDIKVALCVRSHHCRANDFPSLPFHEVEAIADWSIFGTYNVNMSGFQRLRYIGPRFCADDSASFGLIDFSGLKCITKIGDEFLCPCKVQKVVFGEGFSSVREIGDSFLANLCVAHIEGLEYFTGVKKLGEYFMENTCFQDDEEDDPVGETGDKDYSIDVGAFLQNLDTVPPNFCENVIIKEVKVGTTSLAEFIKSKATPSS